MFHANTAEAALNEELLQLVSKKIVGLRLSPVAFFAIRLLVVAVVASEETVALVAFASAPSPCALRARETVAAGKRGAVDNVRQRVFALPLPWDRLRPASCLPVTLSEPVLEAPQCPRGLIGACVRLKVRGLLPRDWRDWLKKGWLGLNVVQPGTRAAAL